MLPGALATPVVDRDEARFAQASRQMFEAVALSEARLDPALHAGGLLVPQVGESPRINKPPLIYWLQTAAAAIATGGDPGADAIWMYRLPSVLAAALGVLATWWVAGRLFAHRPDAAVLALLAGGMLAVCPIYAWDARQARADQVMVACTTIAMAALWCAGRRHAERSGLRSLLLPHTLLWAAVALGVLAKGPITPMVVGCTLIAYRMTARRALVPWRWVGAGLVLVLVLLAPWFIAVGGAIGWERLGEVLHAELIERSASAKEGHAGPPGYHLVLLAALFWPGSLLTAWAIGVAVRRVLRARRSGTVASPLPEAFLLAWLAPAWIVFELVSTKLPHYTMPLYPAIAIITARALVATPRLLAVRQSSRPHPPGTLGWIIWSVIGLGWLVAVPVVVGWPGWSDAGAWPNPEARMALTGLFVAGALVAWFGLLRVARMHRPMWATPLAIVALAVSHALVPAVLLARHHDLWVTDRLVRALEADGWSPGEPLAAIGYHEDSLMFRSRGRLQRWAASEPLATLPDDVTYLVAPADRPMPNGWRTIETVTGLNYSNGDRVRLRVLVRERGAQP